MLTRWQTSGAEALTISVHAFYNTSMSDPWTEDDEQTRKRTEQYMVWVECFGILSRMRPLQAQSSHTHAQCVVIESHQRMEEDASLNRRRHGRLSAYKEERLLDSTNLDSHARSNVALW